MNPLPPGFHRFDRPEWARLGAGVSATPDLPPDSGPVSNGEWQEVYVPLGYLVGVHIDGREGLRRRLSTLGVRRGGPFIVGLAGSVASGKSTCASALAAMVRARPGRPSVAVVSTDGFLLPNSILGPRGLVARKGYPETYDPALITDVLGALSAGAESVSVPTYSHVVYDTVGPPQVLHSPDIVILEGVNALAPPMADFCSLRIYLDADESHLRAWYVARFLGLIEAARDDPSSFFAQWTELGPSDASALAVAVWESVNLPNLIDHILATRERADVVLHKGPDHAITDVLVRIP